MPWDGVCLHTACRTESPRGLGTRPLHKLKLSFELGLSVLDFVWRLQASTAGSRDLVIDVQQAMACITFHPGMICFELKSTSPEHGPRMQEAVTYSDSWLRQSDPKKRWWVANITASLDHLDYDCVIVAGSVHVACTWTVCEVVIRHEIKAYFHFQSVRRMSPFHGLFRVL